MNMTLTIGSLCTGIGGLEHGLTLAGLDTHPVFVSDIDRGACAWLEANSTAPNLGDFTALEELPPVDILTAGFPCQPLSLAGERKGLDDDRWLFDDICRLVSRMGTRPVLFLENVPGLLTANGGHAMAAVVSGLAAIGYSLDYGTLEAAAVGAPHQRRRWWGVARHASHVYEKWGVVGSGGNRRPSAPPRGANRVAQNTDGESWRALPGAASRQTQSGRPRPDIGRRSGTFATDADSARQQSERVAGSDAAAVARFASAAETNRARFGQYAAAVTRWEHVTGCPAPDPVTDDKLSPHFVEWMMGYPAGWVTDTLTSRRQALHALGNAVVPQCAAEAFTQLLQRADTVSEIVPAG